MTKSIRFLVNPISGIHPNSGRTISTLKRHMEGTDYDCSFAISKAAGHMPELAREAVNEGIDIIVAVGGDGTVNEVASAVKGSDSVLGIIPKGSGNGLARHLGIPLTTKAALDVILKGKQIKMDCGIVESKPFFCTMGVGFDAKVGMDYSLSGHRGFITYADMALKSWGSYKPKEYTITIDGRTIIKKAALITIANANQWGNGFHIAPNASVMDGVFDITLVRTLKSPHTLDMPIQILGYTIDKNADIETYRGKSIQIKSSGPDYFHLDGEPYNWEGSEDSGGCTLNIEMNPGCLNVFENRK